jgi:hypothetical protein
MTDRHALFSHYYWAIWCLNINEVRTACLQPPSNESWQGVMQQLQLSRQQLREVVDARRGLLTELQRVAAEWQKVLPTLALQLLQVRCICGGLSCAGMCMMCVQLSEQMRSSSVPAAASMVTCAQTCSSDLIDAEQLSFLSCMLLLLLHCAGQVPKEQWHTVAAVQAMVDNLAAEREAVVAFLHTIVDEVSQCAALQGFCSCV